MKEQFRDLPDHPGYIISSYGRVINKERGRELTVKNNGKSVCIAGGKKGVNTTVSVPRAMYQAFVDPDIPERMVVVCDGILRLENLRVMTVRQRNLNAASSKKFIPVSPEDTACQLMREWLCRAWLGLSG